MDSEEQYRLQTNGDGHCADPQAVQHQNGQPAVLSLDQTAADLRALFVSVQRNKRTGSLDSKPISGIVNLVPTILYHLHQMAEFERALDEERSASSEELPPGSPLEGEGKDTRDEPCPSCLRLSNELEEARKERDACAQKAADAVLQRNAAEAQLEQAKRERDEARAVLTQIADQATEFEIARAARWALSLPASPSLCGGEEVYSPSSSSLPAHVADATATETPRSDGGGE